MPLSAADVVLAAIAARTEHIRLNSAVTVISSDDPVRVFQRYATLDAVSGGRAEVILGRGIEHRVLPALRLRPERLRGAVRGEGRPLRRTPQGEARHLVRQHPCALDGISVYPHSESGAIPTWIGVGGSPQSVVRTARYGFSLMLAIIGGDTARFAPFSRLFQQALDGVRTAPRARRRARARPCRRHRRTGGGGVLSRIPGG
jgi:alkanesulfonate monooxygenase SsuD/methylene tetrahydromethanopterin reductase-like flavin-dependent oxidoreductase (luciferase family)